MKRRASKSATPVAPKATPAKSAPPSVASTKAKPSKPTAFGDAKTGELVPQAHGGALRRGGPNKGGTGRPPSVLREKLRGSFEQRVHVMEAVADGVPMVRTTVPLGAVMPMILEQLEIRDNKIVVKDPTMLEVIQLEGIKSASPKDRLLALGEMAKYGLGPVPQEIHGKLTGQFEVRVVVQREGRRVTAS